MKEFVKIRKFKITGRHLRIIVKIYYKNFENFQERLFDKCILDFI